MNDTGSWNWDRVGSSHWAEPSEDSYYLVHRWKRLGRARVLDLGCGIGRHALLFAANGFIVTALDSSESGLRTLARTAQKRGLAVETVRSDLRKLPFDSSSFDAIVAYHSIYHLDSAGMEAAVAELRRTLRPGGEVFLTLNSKSSLTFSDPQNQVVDENVRMKQEEDGSVLPHYYCDLQDLHRLFTGFNIMGLRHIENFYNGMSSRHYFVLAGA